MAGSADGYLNCMRCGHSLSQKELLFRIPHHRWSFRQKWSLSQIAQSTLGNLFHDSEKHSSHRLANEEFSDFEDCLQMECAKSYGAEYIVTRNVSDYSTSDMKAILPSEYLRL